MAWRMRARHRLREPETPVDRASDAEIVALLRACRSARDRLIVLVMARAGLRRGELCGLRRSDVHLLADSRPLGCEVARAHLHVVRREDNPNGAWAKSRRQRVVPLDFLVVQAFDSYEFERMRVAAAAGSDFVLVNLFRAPVGAPMRPDAVGELLAAALAAGRARPPVRPHQLRHAFATNLADAGGGIDVIADLLGHASVTFLAGLCPSRPGPAARRGGRGAQPPRAGRGRTGERGVRAEPRRRPRWPRPGRRAGRGQFPHVLAGVVLTGPAAVLAGRCSTRVPDRDRLGPGHPGVVPTGRASAAGAPVCAARAARPPRTGCACSAAAGWNSVVWPWPRWGCWRPPAGRAWTSPGDGLPGRGLPAPVDERRDPLCRPISISSGRSAESWPSSSRARTRGRCRAWGCARSPPAPGSCPAHASATAPPICCGCAEPPPRRVWSTRPGGGPSRRRSPAPGTPSCAPAGAGRGAGAVRGAAARRPRASRPATGAALDLRTSCAASRWPPSPTPWHRPTASADGAILACSSTRGGGCSTPRPRSAQGRVGHDGVRASRRLSFTAISQDWLRASRQGWASHDLPRRRGTHGGDKTRHHITSLAAVVGVACGTRPDRGDTRRCWGAPTSRPSWPDWPTWINRADQQPDPAPGLPRGPRGPHPAALAGTDRPRRPGRRAQRRVRAAPRRHPRPPRTGRTRAGTCPPGSCPALRALDQISSPQSAPPWRSPWTPADGPRRSAR